MCTSIRLQANGCYFGRNLDLEYEFGERVVLTPRNYRFPFRRMEARRAQYAMIGMATVADGYPLYAEAMNEKGLYIAGLNFPGNAYYAKDEAADCDNLSPFELIPWLLSQCTSVSEAEPLLRRLHLVAINFRADMPLTPLHWHIADRERSIVLEAMRDGIHIYENPTDVLTNNPPFDFQLTNLRQYMGLSAAQPGEHFSGTLQLSPFGQGFGALGLPGDFSPASRFVKAAFLRANSAAEPEIDAAPYAEMPANTTASSNNRTAAPTVTAGEADSVSQFFHLLNAVAMVRGAVLTPEGKYDITTYSCCISADTRTFYYTTYGNQQISAVCMDRENLDGDALLEYPLIKELQVHFQN